MNEKDVTKNEEIIEEPKNENIDNELECNEEQTDELSLLKEKLKESEDKYLRANADFENIKKRLEKEKIQVVDYANEVFARDILSVADTLDMAYKSIDETKGDEVVSKIKEGISLTMEQLKKVFEKHGIKAVETSGEFDPNIHNAMMKVDSDEYESGQIVQCFQKGYTIKDRVLRPAMVSVAK